LIAAVVYRQRLAAATAKPARPRRRRAKPNDAAFQQRTARGGPKPGCAPESAGPGNAGGRLRPLGLDPSAPPPSRRPGPSRSANRDRAAGAAPSAAPAPHHAKHQHHHDHDDQHPQPCRDGGLLGRPRQFAV